MLKMIALAALLPLAACSSTPTNNVTTINSIISGAQEACNLVPSKTSVDTLVTANKGTMNVQQLITLICNSYNNNKKPGVTAGSNVSTFTVYINGQTVEVTGAVL